MRKTVGLIMGVMNEAHRLRDCLDWHLPYMDEVVIVDQQSEDGTPEIIKEYQAKSTIPFTFLPRERCGFSEKYLQEACDLLHTDWVIYIDADEKFPKDFLEQMHQLIETEFYDGFRFERDNYFDIQVFNDAVPIEPKRITVKHPARDQQVRLTRRSMSVFPPQIHVRVRVRGENGDEKIQTLDYAMYHLKTLEEQWNDNSSYMPAVLAVEEMERKKREARENRS